MRASIEVVSSLVIISSRDVPDNVAKKVGLRLSRTLAEQTETVGGPTVVAFGGLTVTAKYRDREAASAALETVRRIVDAARVE